MSSDSGVILNGKQSKNKRPRYVYYDGPLKNCDPEDGRAILELYIVHGLGYTPIRHILGLKTDHLAEDVVRQCMLGRKQVDGAAGWLKCPEVHTISDASAERIKMFMEKYKTADDPYNKGMLLRRNWSDESRHGRTLKPVMCNACHHQIGEGSNFCGFCGKPRGWKPSKLQSKILSAGGNMK